MSEHGENINFGWQSLLLLNQIFELIEIHTKQIEPVSENI